ncbi:ATPase [Aureococcus anophagefferens]|nr:ATPase [Aureococcus anophagefferens]
MDHFASPAGSFKAATAAPVMPPPPRARPPPPRAPAAARDETPDKPAGEGFMDHFATTAGSFKGKDGDSKPKSTSSGTPDWLSEAPAPTWTPTRKPEAGGTYMPAPATPAPARVARGPDGRIREVADGGAKAADGISMDHFAATAGYVPPLGGRVAGSLDAFAQDKREATGFSSGTDRLSAPPQPSFAAPPMASVAQPAFGGAQDHFATKDVDSGLMNDLEREVRETEELLRRLKAAQAAVAAGVDAASRASPAAKAVPAKAAGGGIMDRFASTARAFKGMDATPPPPPAAPPPRPAAAAPTTAAGRGSMRRAPSAGAYDYKTTIQSRRAEQAERRAAWLSGSAVGTPPPAATAAPAKAKADAAMAKADAAAKERQVVAARLADKAKADATARAKADAAAKARAYEDAKEATAATPALGRGRAFKAKSTSSGTPDWLGAAPLASPAARRPPGPARPPGQAAPPRARPPPPRAPAAVKDETPDKPAGEGFMDHFATAGSFKGKERDFKPATGASSGTPDWLGAAPPASPAATAAPVRPPPPRAPAVVKDETPDKPAGEGFMDHFATTGSFKGKDGDSKPKSTSSGTPDWLSEAPAPTWTPTRKPAAGGTNTPAPATAAPVRPPPPRAPAAAKDETPDKPAGEGFMDHFATTAGSFKGKDGGSKPKSTSSGTPDWLSEAPAPTPPPPRAPAVVKDETPDKPAGEGFMDHFATTAGSFKGKDGGSKPKSTSSGTPDWLSEAPAPTWTPTRKPAAGGTNTPAPATAAPVRPPPPRAPAAAKDETPDKPAGEGFMDHFATTSSFKGKERDFKPATGASSGTPDWLGAAPPASPAATTAPVRPPPPRAPAAVKDETPDKPAGEGFMDHRRPRARSRARTVASSRPRAPRPGLLTG